MPVQSSFAFSAGPQRLEEMDRAPCNAHALDLLASAPGWPFTALCLIGPPRAGLSSLARAWAARFEAVLVLPEIFTDLPAPQMSALAAGYTVLDDADNPLQETQLLFLLNQVAEKKGRILLTAHTPPRRWPVRNRDLASRLNAMPLAEIGAMDDAMFAARLATQLGRYRLILPDDVAAYLSLRLERTYADVEECVTRLAGHTGPAQGLTVPLARSVLDEMYGPSRDESANDDDT